MEYVKATIPNCENLKHNLKNYLQKTIDESLKFKSSQKPLLDEEGDVLDADILQEPLVVDPP